MPIQNFKPLATNKAKKNALQILEAGLTTAEPKNFLKFFLITILLQLPQFSPLKLECILK